VQSVQFYCLGTELDIGAKRNDIETSLRVNSNDRSEPGRDIVQCGW
jgi:hypothetical protein